MSTSPLAISLGDPAGVGPELILAAWQARHEHPLPPFLVAGGGGVLAAAARRLELQVPIAPLADPAEAATAFAAALPVLPGPDGSSFSPGRPDETGAALALQSLDLALRLAVCGKVAALVTAPVSKAQIARVDPGFIGQTERCADACGTNRDDAVMLLAGPHIKAVPLTVHCPLAEVPRRITRDLICTRARIVARAMARDFGLAHPRLAIAGLNPHAGEEGRMGREEIETIVPAITALQEEGIAASGPHPADTLFAPPMRGRYDVALAMYHDQALAPMKALDFDSGVNMTLGLPIVRTSPDHGTAFAIAGQGIANPGAMLAAIRMAGEVAARRAGALG